MKKLLFTAVLFITSLSAFSQQQIEQEAYYRVAKVKDSVSLFNGSLKLINIFKQQLNVLYETRNLPQEEVKKQFIGRTYVPYQQFWESYVGDSNTYYESVMKPLIKDSLRMIARKSLLFSSFNIDNFFSLTASVISCYSGKNPSGTWFIAFGHGATDMGGFGDGRMVLDLTHSKTDIAYVQMILPHEINHQVYDKNVVEDTSARGLYRVINEGFAVYVNQVVFGDKYTLGEYLQYTQPELEFCRANEDVIFKKLKPFLFTNSKEHALALANRGQKPFNDGPGAIGYYVGYKIVEAYVLRHGKESWKDIYNLSPAEVLQKSGYGS